MCYGEIRLVTYIMQRYMNNKYTFIYLCIFVFDFLWGLSNPCIRSSNNSWIFLSMPIVDSLHECIGQCQNKIL